MKPLSIRCRIAPCVWLGILLTTALSIEAGEPGRTYSYDGKGRLVGVVFDTGEWISYNYDSLGNLLSREISSGHHLLILRAGTGSGSISSSPVGIDCGLDCDQDYPSGAEARLMVQASVGSSFAGWSGDADCSDGVVTMSADRTCTATFQLLPGAVALQVNKAGTGEGRVTSTPAGVDCGAVCRANFPSGSQVFLTAAAIPGSSFAGWSGDADCSDGVVIMSSARTCVATFQPLPGTVALQVSKAGTGEGRVTSTPAGLDCGAVCRANFPTGAQVVLTATALPGSFFAGWSGDADCADGTVTMSAARGCVATFQLMPVTHSLTINKLGAGSGRVTSIPAGIDCGVDCAETLPAGTQVSLQAVPDAGSGPVVWGGDPDCADGVVTLSADRACTATFSLAVTCSGVWTSGGPLGGTVRLVWIDPARPEHLLAGGDGGLFESQNAGESWIATSLGARPVYALAVDPATPTTWYATSYIYVFKSTDAGRTWSASSMAPGTGSVVAIAVDPSSPSRLWAGQNWPGLVKSTDAGATWSAVNIGVASTAVTALVVDPSRPQTIYLGSMTSGVAKSTDGGASWSWIGLSFSSIRSLLMDRRSSSTLFAATTAGIYRSINEGGTWSPVVATGAAALAQAPGELSTFYASDGGNVWKSLDGGATWNLTGTVSLAGAALGMAVSPLSPSTVYLATAGRGLLVSVDGGRTWREVNLGLTNFATYGVTVEPGNPLTAYTSHQDGGLFKTTDGGGRWTAVARDSQQGWILNVAAGSQSTLYVAAVSGVFKSLDGGASWSNASAGLAGLFPSHLAVPATDPNTVYVIVGGTLNKSSDGARSWRTIGGGVGNITQMWIHPNDPAKVLALTREAGIAKLFRSVDGGSTWSLGGSGLAVAEVNSMAFDPSQPTTVYAVIAAGIYKSTDGGMSWSFLSALPAYAYSVAVHPSISSVLYVGTYWGGVYRSLNGGVSWSPWNAGLQAWNVTSLAAVASSPVVLYAATDSRGIYQISECSELPLTVSRLGTGSGTVVSAPAGIDCGPDCSELYPLGTEVWLTAQAAAGSQFSGWSGEGCSGTGGCRVVMGQARSVTATFSRPSWPLTVYRFGTGTGRVVSQPAGIDCGGACSGIFSEGTVITLDARPDAGSAFAGWTGDCPNGQVTISAARTCGAAFIPQTSSGGLGFYSVTPCRMLDTRLTTGPLLSGARQAFRLAEICGIPAAATSLSVNVTTAGATGGGDLVLWPGDLSKPGTTVISFLPATARANNAILALARDGSGFVAAEASVAGNGSVHLIIDVNGYFQ